MKKEDAIKYLQQLYPYGGHCWLDEQRIEAIGMAIKALQEEPVSDDLEEVAHKYAEGENPTCPCEECLIKTFKAGAKWQKEQDQSIIELAEDHAMLAGMEKMKEQIMKDAVVMEAHEEYGELWGDIRKFNTEKGKKYKVIIIKQEDD